MKRLLTSAAVAALMGTMAHAEAHTNMDLSYNATEGDYFATNLIGSRLYATETEMTADTNVADLNGEWDDIGEINDFIVSAEGEVTAVIVGVGGFLGIGEKDVVVSMDMINAMDDDDGNRFLVINSTQEALENAPEFDYDELDMDIADENEQAGTDGDGQVQETEEQQDAQNEANEETQEAADEQADVEADAAEMDATETAEADAEMTTEADAATTEADAEVAADNAGADTMATDTMAVPEGYALVPVTELTSEELTGVEVITSDDEWVGEVSSLIMNEQGQITEAVIDVGGFLGMGEKPVALNFDQLEIMREEGSGNLQVNINATREELDSMPAYAE